MKEIKERAKDKECARERIKDKIVNNFYRKKDDKEVKN